MKTKIHAEELFTVIHIKYSRMRNRKDQKRKRLERQGKKKKKVQMLLKHRILAHMCARARVCVWCVRICMHLYACVSFVHMCLHVRYWVTPESITTITKNQVKERGWGGGMKTCRTIISHNKISNRWPSNYRKITLKKSRKSEIYVQIIEM